MKKSSKGVLVIIIIMIILSLTGGIVGLLASMNTPTTQPKDDVKKEDYQITYKYYIDNTEVTKEQIDASKETKTTCDETDTTCIPTIKPATIKYTNYSCTNNVKGEWQDSSWEFTPDLTANTTCKLYFESTVHNVKVTVSNGTLPADNIEGILENKVGETSTMIITPTLGYKFDKVECDDASAKAEFNIETNTLSISNVTKNTTCNISFKLNDYSVEVQVTYGSVTENTKSANYGGSVTFNVTPAENYGDALVSCTNNQKGEYNKDTKVLTVSSLTSDTKCTVQFKSIKYNVNLTVVNGTLVGTSPISTTPNGSVSFGINVNDGFGYTGATIDCGTQNVKTNIIGTSNVVQISEINQDLNCTLTLKKLETTENTN